MVGARGLVLAIVLVAARIDPALAGPATAPGSSPPGGAGESSVTPSGGFGINFSGDVVFSPVFSSPVQQLFSAPSDFQGVGTTGTLPDSLLNTDTALMSALIPPAYTDPAIPPMGSVIETLPNPIHRHPAYAAATQLGIPSYYCLTQAQQNAKQFRYWSFTQLSEPGVDPIGRITDSGVPDRQAVVNSADTNDEWCSANLPRSWAVQPFSMNIWGPVTVLGLGIFAFWAARGFKNP